MWTLLAVITGGSGRMVAVAVTAVGGKTLTPAEVRLVKVTVRLPATVPCCIVPPVIGDTVVAPAGTVKLSVVPPAANCNAGSMYPA
jgi:hypothetical protein